MRMRMRAERRKHRKRPHGPMTVRKLSISVPAEVGETIKAAAPGDGKPLSACLAEAGPITISSSPPAPARR